MKKNLIILATFTGLFVLMACGSDNASAANGSVAQTEKTAAELYKKNCKSCHGAEGNRGLSGAADLSTSEMPLEDRIKIVANGKGRMMPYGDMLTADEIKKVSEYSMTLKK